MPITVMNPTELAGQVQVIPRLIRFESTDTVATMTAAGYLNSTNLQGNPIQNGDFAFASSTVSGTTTNYAFRVSIPSSGIITLVTIIDALTGASTPGDFAVFNDTEGGLIDLGYLPTNASLTNVVMQSGAAVAGDIPAYADVNGTLTNTHAYVASNTALTNIAMATTSGVTPAEGLAAVFADASGTIKALSATAWLPFVVNINVTHTTLASAGTVTAIASSGSHQFQILDIFLNVTGTDFSGGSGNRLLQVTDATNVYTVIPAADLQTLVNAKWGSTAVPAPATASYYTPTVAGANVVISYSGGSTDYTAGSATITIVAVRVA